MKRWPATTRASSSRSPSLSASAPALVIFVASRVILGAYNISAEAAALAQRVMTVMCSAQWIKAANLIIIVGILRSGGDTKFGLFVDVAPMWLIGIPRR